MVPVRLQLKNFLSYGSKTQTIDLEEHHLICLSGKNGHGKSALLDAMTWCLWGQARKTTGASKADEGILRLGQTHVFVSCEFICYNTRYRVRREYIKGGKKGEARLYFGIYDAHEDRFRSLTETTTKETQQAIQHVIGLDYESFANSVFVRQGQSNAFSRKSPKERKEILARILGLEQYEQYRSYAQEYVRSYDYYMHHIQQTCKQLQHEIAEKESIQASHEQQTQQIQQAKDQEHKLIEQEQYYARTIQAYTHQQQQYDHLSQRYKHLQEQWNEHTQLLLSYVSAWRKTHAQQCRSRDEQTRQEYDRYQHHLKQLQWQYARYQQAEEHMYQQRHAAEERKQQLYHQFLKQHQQAHTDMQEAAYHLQEVQKACHAYSEDIDTKKKQYHELIQEFQHTYAPQQDQDEKDPERMESLLHTYIHQAGRLYSMQRMLQARWQRNEQYRIARMKRALSVCHNRIARTKEHLARAREHEKQSHAHQWESYQQSLHQFLSHILTTYRQYQQLKTQYNHALERYQYYQRIYHKYQEKDAFTYKLQADAYYQELKQRVIFWQSQCEKHSVSRNDIEKVNTHLQHLQDQLFATRAQAYHNIQRERRHYIRHLIHTLKRIKREMKDAQKQLRTFADLSSHKEKAERQRQDFLNQLHHIRQYKEQAMQKQGALSQKIAYIQEKEKAYQQYTQQYSAYQAERDMYVQVAQAFSRDGIQALLIEHAIPEIEQEANALLAELTDNQSHIIIDSLRDLKSGKTKETLDIKISDNLGIRPYELFSGGEAFRIDFALRIAISTLLTRRAGTQLQTLIIDEGFGSQDEEGLHYIMDAIHRIRHHFSKIIIVSHLTTLKDQFPTQLLVHKGPQGSHVNVHLQG